jgi:hypothetical protein
MRRPCVLVLAGGMLAGGVLGQERPVVNWAAPLYWSPGEAAATPLEDGERALVRSKAAPALTTSPVPLIGITPCRIVDTRNASMPAGYGPPQLSAGVPRSFTLSGQCGIAAGAQAVSLNITVVAPAGLGYVLLYPEGGSQPVVSTLNFTAGQTVANAAIVPLGAGGGITVAAALSNTELLIDTNGYYAGAAVGSANTFLGVGAGNVTMSGDFNTAVGTSAFTNNDTGNSCVAMGATALLHNTGGEGNTGLGAEAIRDNTTGFFNTAVGISTLVRNTAGSLNTAIGQGALYWAEGSYNISLGAFSGNNLMTGGNNMYLGTGGGDANESNTLRIGGDAHYRAFIAAVRGVTTGVPDAIPVMIDSAGQLGTVSSSARFKEDIADMADASGGLLKLRPVTFRYKGQAGGARQFGMVAEEVEEVLPELVVHGPSGEAETVLYHEMPAMLVNELQKQQKRIEFQEDEIAALRARLAALEAQRPIVREVP